MIPRKITMLTTMKGLMENKILFLFYRPKMRLLQGTIQENMLKVLIWLRRALFCLWTTKSIIVWIILPTIQRRTKTIQDQYTVWFTINSFWFSGTLRSEWNLERKKERSLVILELIVLTSIAKEIMWAICCVMARKTKFSL